MHQFDALLCFVVVWLTSILPNSQGQFTSLIRITRPLQWRHNGRHGVSNHQPHDCLLNRLFRHRSKKTSKLRVTGLCEGNSPVTCEFPSQRAINAENVSIWWRHHVNSLTIRADFRFAPSQWETALLCNDVSDWLGASIKSALIMISSRQNKTKDKTHICAGYSHLLAKLAD